LTIYLLPAATIVGLIVLAVRLRAKLYAAEITSESWQTAYCSVSEKLDHLKRKPQYPPTMVPSGLEVVVGEIKAPIFKPWAKIVPDRSMEVRDYTILDGNTIVDQKSLPNSVAMCVGDELNIFFETKMPCSTDLNTSSDAL
jgi:hypothetical protein